MYCFSKKYKIVCSVIPTKVFHFQAEYHHDHPRGINPVQLNDVIFTLHAIFVTLITITQCFMYDVSTVNESFINSYIFTNLSLS